MNLVHLMPAWLKRLAWRVLPPATAQRIHDRAARDDYVPWMVSRESPLTLAADRALGRRPSLHRLVVHLTDHCNLNCRGCSHFSNVAQPSFADPELMRADFTRLAETFAGITEIYLMGGEPLLHPRVDEFPAIARAAFPDARIVLLTNGVLVPRMGEPFWRALRESRVTLICDLYPIGLPVETIERLAEQRGVDLEWTDPRGEFFKLPIDVTGSQDPTWAFQHCGGLNNCVTLRDGRLYPCAYAAYGDIPADRFGLDELRPGDDDSIAIDGTRTPQEVFDFLCRPVPWCRFCDVGHVTTFAWERGKGEAGDWTTGTPEEVPRG